MTRPFAFAAALAWLALAFFASCSTQRGRNADCGGDFVFVEGGTFLMGSDGGDDDEKPVHPVTVGGFMMCRHEVTQAEWEKFMGGNPSRFSGGSRPVECVTWNEAVEYCNRRSVTEGLTPCYRGSGDDITCDWSADGYRLPTEAEWEFAARGGSRSRGHEFSGSGDVGSVAWHKDNGGRETHDVMTKSPNELGLYDMSGNVWEWCWDWYDCGFYGRSPTADPRGSSSGAGRVGRGGGWDGGASVCRVSFRLGILPGHSYHNIGFRVVRSASR